MKSVNIFHFRQGNIETIAHIGANIWAIVGIILLLRSPVFADDTLMGESGHTVYPVNTDKIRLEYEHVVIKMDGSNDHRNASVKCVFTFENTSAQAIKTKAGFPGNEFRDDPYMGNNAAPNLTLFTAVVEGREKYVDVRREILKEDQYEEEDGRGGITKFAVTDYRYWYTWDAIFPPGKSINIENTYSLTPSSDSVQWLIEYVLVTGANWKGNIGQAIVEVWYPSEADLKMRVRDIQPKGYRIEGRRIKWDLRDFKPKENIKVVEKWIR